MQSLSTTILMGLLNTRILNQEVAELENQLLLYMTMVNLLSTPILKPKEAAGIQQELIHRISTAAQTHMLNDQNLHKGEAASITKTPNAHIPATQIHFTRLQDFAPKGAHTEKDPMIYTPTKLTKSSFNKQDYL